MSRGHQGIISGNAMLRMQLWQPEKYLKKTTYHCFSSYHSGIFKRWVTRKYFKNCWLTFQLPYFENHSNY